MTSFKEGATATLALIVGLAVIAVLAVGVWQLGWFVSAKNVDRQVHIDNRNTGTQTAWHDQALQDIRDFTLLDPSDTARRGALRNDACNLIGRLRPDYLTQDLSDFKNQEC